MPRLCAAVAVLVCLTLPARAGDDWLKIFNGKDFTGWVGDPRHWSVKDGALTGVTDGDIPYNKFVIWTGGELKNFELKLKFRLVGNNSGINYRSKWLKDAGEHVVAGYQADMDVQGVHTGNLYEERGRTFLALRGQKVVIAPDGDRFLVGRTGDPLKLIEGLDHAAWNDYHITARGNHIVHALNGKTLVDVVDHQADKCSLKGVLGFQVHRGPAMTVQFKDIYVRHLPPGGVLTPDQTPVPAGAPKLAPGPARFPKK